MQGASGVIIFNEGNPGRTDLLDRQVWSTPRENPFVPTIPVAFTTFAGGSALLDQYRTGPAPVMNITINAIVDAKP